MDLIKKKKYFTVFLISRTCHFLLWSAGRLGSVSSRRPEGSKRDLWGSYNLLSCHSWSHRHGTLVGTSRWSAAQPGFHVSMGPVEVGCSKSSSCLQGMLSWLCHYVWSPALLQLKKKIIFQTGCYTDLIVFQKIIQSLISQTIQSFGE